MEKIKKPFRKEINIEFLQISIWVVFSDDICGQKEWWAKQQGLKIGGVQLQKDIDRTAAEVMYEKNYYKDYLISFPFKADVNDIGHEVYHVVTRILASHQLESGNNKKETGAYLTGWLLEKCFEFQKLSNTINKPKNKKQ